jgi:hypothetical protein
MTDTPRTQADLLTLFGDIPVIQGRITPQMMRDFIVSVGVTTEAVINVKAAPYLAKGDGVTDDTAAITAALASGAKSFVFPKGDYYLGAHSSAFTAFNLSGLGDGLTFISNGASFIQNTTGILTLENEFFNLSGNNHTRFLGHWNFTDQGGSFYPTITVDKGAVGIHIRDSCVDTYIQSVQATNCRQAVAIITAGSGGTSRDIRIESLSALGCKYGFTAAENGDGVWLGHLYAENCSRPFFVYGVTGHDLSVIIKDNSTADNSLIKRYTRNTSNIKVRIKNSVVNANAKPILGIDHQNDDGAASRIDNVSIEYDNYITDSQAAINLALITPRSFSAAGVENTGVCPHTYDNIRLSGSRGPFNFDLLPGFTSCTNKGRLSLPTNAIITAPTYNSFVPANVTTYERCTSYTPTWLCNSGTNPTLGNGTLTGKYSRDGDRVTVDVALIMGSTTTFGTGAYWTFSLPYNNTGVAPFEIGSAAFLHSTFTSGIAVMQFSGGNFVTLLPTTASGNYVGPTLPFTWASGDVIRFSISYQVAASW